MQFPYDQYLRTSLLFPLFMIGLALWGIVPGLVHIIYVVLHKQPWRVDNLVRVSSLLLLSGTFICVGAGRLMHGGIHLLYERESDAIMVQGEIEKIDNLNILAFPNLDCTYTDGNTHGVQITLKGVCYTAIEKGTLKIGDNVKINYLPQSGFILHIEKINLKE